MNELVKILYPHHQEIPKGIVQSCTCYLPQPSYLLHGFREQVKDLKMPTFELEANPASRAHVCGSPS